MQSLETEVKISVRDRRALEHKLAAAAFRLVTPSTFERNILYDTPQRTLRSRHQILRIRLYGDKWVLTHKRMPEDTLDQEHHKQRIETETEIADGEAMAHVLCSLGYVPAFVYEKRRTEYADPTGHCVIDETPIGLFAELEGPADWIDATLRKLEVPPADVMTLSYGRLFENWKRASGSAAENLTFDEIGNALHHP